MREEGEEGVEGGGGRGMWHRDENYVIRSARNGDDNGDEIIVRTNNESEWYNEEFDEISRVKKMKHSYQRLDLQLDTMNFKMR